MARERVDLERLPERVPVRMWARDTTTGRREVGYGRFGRYGWYAHRAGTRTVEAWIVTDERAACTLIQRWIGSGCWREIPAAVVS